MPTKTKSKAKSKVKWSGGGSVAKRRKFRSFPHTLTKRQLERVRALVADPQAIDNIEQGLPYELMQSFLDVIGMSLHEAAGVLRIPLRTFSRRKKEGKLSPAESDRFSRLCRIYDQTLGFFEGNKEETMAWLSGPKRALGNRTPFSLIKTDLGTREVEALLGRLTYGVII